MCILELLLAITGFLKKNGLVISFIIREITRLKDIEESITKIVIKPIIRPITRPALK